MRAVLGGCLCVLWSTLLTAPGQAQEDCTARNVLGVSRSIEIDTTGGPWFGEPRGDPDFLAPGEVVLTFDDGPSPRATRSILAALAAQCTKATFFVLGQMATAHPDIVREIGAQGHTIGTHTWSHPNLQQLSYESAKAQIESAFTAVERAAGRPIAPFFRYPYLSHAPAAVAYLRTRNIAQFAVDIDSLDWLRHDAQSVIRTVMARVEHRGKGIILLHDIHPSTASAIPTILASLKAKGFKIVHLRPKTAVATLVAYQTPPRVHPRAPHSGRVVQAESWLRNWKWPEW